LIYSFDQLEIANLVKINKGNIMVI